MTFKRECGEIPLNSRGTKTNDANTPRQGGPFLNEGLERLIRPSSSQSIASLAPIRSLCPSDAVQRFGSRIFCSSKMTQMPISPSLGRCLPHLEAPSDFQCRHDGPLHVDSSALLTSFFSPTSSSARSRSLSLTGVKGLPLVGFLVLDWNTSIVTCNF
jgi:hypothetical protein